MLNPRIGREYKYRYVLPPEVLEAKRAYIAVKREYGICTHETCSRKALPDIDRCQRCRDRNLRTLQRKKERLASE